MLINDRNYVVAVEQHLDRLQSAGLNRLIREICQSTNRKPDRKIRGWFDTLKKRNQRRPNRFDQGLQAT